MRSEDYETLAEYTDEEIEALLKKRLAASLREGSLRLALERVQDELDSVEESIHLWCVNTRADQAVANCSMLERVFNPDGRCDDSGAACPRHWVQKANVVK